MEIKQNALNLQIYKKLRNEVNWKTLSDNQMLKAIEGCLTNFVAFENDVPIGMGRIVGDGAVICYIQELIVHPDYQRKGVGKALMKELIGYVESLRENNTQLMLCLMCAKGRENFYEECGFTARPNENQGPGMIMYLKGEKND